MDTFSVIVSRMADLVHESALADPVEAARHRRFISSRMGMGILALACIPVYLAVRGAPSPQEYGALACLVVPLFAALALSRTGNLALAHVVSSIGFAGLIVCIAGSSGGVRSAAMVWLVAVPLEALLSGSRKAAIGSTFVAGAATLLLAALDGSGVYPPVEAWPSSLAAPVFALAAIAHAGSLVASVSQNEESQRQARMLRDAHDHSLLQATDDLVTWHDSNGHVLKASSASMSLLGVPASALHERGLLGRIHVQDRPAFLKAISDGAIGPRSVNVELRVNVGESFGEESGRFTWVEMRAYRVETAGTGPWAVVAVMRDISEQKRREEDLHLARLRAERADEIKGRFLATVSHELRTPLNAIIGFSEILASDTMTYLDADQRRGYAKIVHESGHHLLEVVNSLLDMSKIETGNFDFSPAPFDASCLLESCFDMMRLKANHQGIGLSREIEPNLPELVADRRACRQILINLISNAVKFTPRGGRVNVALRREKDRLVFTVSDTGMGVSETDLRKLGSPFFQANSTYDRPHEGTGLGLSVVRGLVGLHRGAMAIESSIGEGTTVTVELPIEGEAAAEPVPGATIPIRTGVRRAANGSVKPPATRADALAAGNAAACETKTGDAGGDTDMEFKQSA